jgi:aldose 1-epimerase
MAIKMLGSHDGQPVQQAELVSETGVRVKILSYGAIVSEWLVPVKNSLRPVVLGFPQWESYVEDKVHIGAIVGRVANRISGAEFKLKDKTYKLPANVGTDHLHGGPLGLSKKNWQLEIDEKNNSVVLKLTSPHGDMGYPGEVNFSVTYTLREYRLIIDMKAQVSETTPVSLVQHAYFNLMGEGTIHDHLLQIDADHYTPLNERLLPTGEIRSVTNTLFDFKKEKNMRGPGGEPLDYDINFVFNEHRDKKNPAARAMAPDGSLNLKLWTEQPGMQLYNGQKTGFCFEDQMLPDALHHENFPSILVSPEQDYSHRCEIEIKP